MAKTITALLSLALAMPSTVMGAPRIIIGGPVAKTWIVSTNPPSIERRNFVGPGAQPAATMTPPDSQQPTQRSWAGRHPIALGAIIGAAGGALWGTSVCWKHGKQACGDNLGPLIVGFGAGVGAGIGAGVGFTISLTR